MYHSFILIKSPEVCADAKFKCLKKLMASYPGVFAEILDVVAFNCEDINEIPSMVEDIFEEYKKKPLTIDNHAIATIMGACNAWLKENSRLEIPDGISNFLSRYDINVNDDNCLYVSMQDFVVTLANYATGTRLAQNV